MKKILFPTDFSHNSFHALNYAGELLQNVECTFFVLNVFTEKKGFKSKKTADDSEEKSKKWKEETTTRLERFVSRIKKQEENGKHSYRLISESRDLIQVINTLVNELDIDLIVMGNKGKKSSVPIFLGKTATRTLNLINKCAVLTVPKNASYTVPKEIAFVTDLKKPYKAKVIGPLLYAALLHDTTIRIVHIDEKEPMDESQQWNLDGLLSFIEPVKSSVHHIPNFISKAKIIEMFINEWAIDMLVMVNNEHGFLEKMLREPIIEKMVFTIDIPFLVIPEKP